MSRTSTGSTGEFILRRCWSMPLTFTGVLSLVLANALVGCQGSGFGSTRSVQTPPSMVILLADDAGYVDFGFTGLQDVSTPHIDRIAAEGVTCSQGYVCASVCSPSRAGLLTGRYPQRFGHEMNLPAGSKLGLPVTERTVADRLQQRGYTTGAIGKWHLGEAPPFRPLRRGFDEFRGFLGGSRTYLDRKNLSRRTLWLDGDKPAPLPAAYVTDAIGLEAARFIRDHHSAPFFLYVSFSAVHTPMQALESDLASITPQDSGKRRKLLAMTLALDRAVGEILAAIDDSGIADNTLVMFLNDNGGATNNASDNGPLRGMKGSKFEGGIRVPWAIRWPGHIPAASRFDGPISTLDIAATLLSAAKTPADSFQQLELQQLELDGVDLSDHLSGRRKDDPHEVLFWRRAVAAAVRLGPWKLIRVEGLSTQLFHLEQDPGERDDIASEHPEIAADLLARLERWEQGLIDPLWQTGEVWRRNQVEKHRIDFRGRDKERTRP
ncbi:MAG: sulfatase-like hydrolase/transferase [Planctomycetota bacterium]